MSSDSKSVMLLSIEDPIPELYAGFFSELESRCRLTRARTAEDALRLLGTETFSSILVYEPSIMRICKKGPGKQLANVLVAFTRQGGSTVLACQCSSFARPSDINSFFAKVWGLPWQSGQYLRTTFGLNADAEIQLDNMLAKQHSMKSLNLKGVAAHHLIYHTTADSKLESLVWGPSTVDLIGEGPVILSPYGTGRIGWVGDVNNEKDTWPVVFAMCGL